MSIHITKHSEDYSAAPQISLDDVAEIARLGFKTIICNRPDGEGGALQPTSAQVQAAAKNHGLNFVYVPVIPNKISEQLPAFSEAYTQAAKPVLSYCGTGYRAGVIYKLAMDKATETSSKGILSWFKK